MADGRPEPKSSVPGFAADLAPNITKWPLPTTWEAFLRLMNEMSSNPQIALRQPSWSLFPILAAAVLVTYHAQASRKRPNVFLI